MPLRNNNRRKIVISSQAKEDIENNISYLSENWDHKVVKQFLQKLDTFYFIVSVNPKLFSLHNKSKNIRKYLVSRHNIIYYRVSKQEVQILTFFDTRQNPSKLRKKLK